MNRIFMLSLPIMSAGIIIFFLIVFILVLLTDFVAFIGIKRIFTKKKLVTHIYWSISLLFFITSLIYFLTAGNPELDYVKFRHYFYIFGIFLLIFLPKITLLAFILIEFLFRLLSYFMMLIVKRNSAFSRINQACTKTKILSRIGVFAGIIVFIIILHGIVFNKTNFKVEHISIELKNLPRQFDGFKIVHISDMHIGSFGHANSVRKGVNLIQEQHPDMIIFTGDMINLLAKEAEPYISMFNELKAPYGKYSILGNHDMNDYRKMDTVRANEESIRQLVAIHKQMGFHILLNKHAIIKKETDSIAIIGIESWGLPPFHQFGNLNNAMKGAENLSFKILLSHDPSHWRTEVIRKTDIAMTFSGHTHGLQFGINCCGIKWSPIQYKYPHWLGLYQENEQSIYVNPGFGFIGFPGRVGIRPEITVITLKNKG